MKIPRSILHLLAFALVCWTSHAQSPENRPGVGDRADRLERLERRLNELAERQEQFLRRGGAQMDRQAEPGASENRMMAAGQRSMPRQRADNPMAMQMHKKIHDFLGLVFLIALICNVLLAIWIYTDIRKRGEGSGIFIALALVAGIPAAIIYALTRIGDRKCEAKS